MKHSICHSRTQIRESSGNISESIVLFPFVIFGPLPNIQSELKSLFIKLDSLFLDSRVKHGNDRKMILHCHSRAQIRESSGNISESIVLFPFVIFGLLPNIQ